MFFGNKNATHGHSDFYLNEATNKYFEVKKMGYGSSVKLLSFTATSYDIKRTEAFFLTYLHLVFSNSNSSYYYNNDFSQNVS